MNLSKSEFDSRLSVLKKKLKDQKVDFFILPNSDEFFSEYLPSDQKRIEYLTGFTGSNALIVVGQIKSYFFTDGRYILQAKKQLNLTEFEIFNIAKKSVSQWLAGNLKEKQTLALDSKLSGINFVEFCQKLITEKSGRLLFLSPNPVEPVYDNDLLSKESPVFFCNKDLAGADSLTKRDLILQHLEGDALLVAKPENICWLLNLRASDVEFTPLLLAYGILFKNGEVELFVNPKRITDQMSDSGQQNLIKVKLTPPGYLDLRLAVLRKSIAKIQIDIASTNYWLYDLLQKNNFAIIAKTDAIEIAKACKNAAEIKSAIKAHEIDGLALTRFLFWLENTLQNGLITDEIKAAQKLLELRRQHPAFLYPSFASISAFAANGAVIHYQANRQTNKKISGNSLYLIDSGGQYLGSDFLGTTDITRTLAIGQPDAEMIENFTRVLKGHIAVAQAKFPCGSSGAQLDVLARIHLWRAKKDYDHGSGHGVGSFLSVHEGPCAISKRAHQPLLPGMILSNEPGFYKEGEYGIRIENLMLVEKCDDNFLQFRTLSLAPLDPNLINFAMLTYPERKWLKEYHELVLKTFEHCLEAEEKTWLQNLTRKFKSAS